MFIRPRFPCATKGDLAVAKRELLAKRQLELLAGGAKNDRSPHEEDGLG
jgi:hypothetical protein